jgi:alginate O-acetyltransferase complex protein AlgJ
MKTFLLGAAILFSLFLGLPLFQWIAGFPPDIPLAGVENTATPPARSLAAWWRGTMQSEFDTWLNQRMGLRGALVRTANQINFSLFRELPKRSGTQVLFGRNGFLFEKAYVDTYNKNGKRPESELQGKSAATRRLQDRLAADGIAFLLVIAPSKAEIYPEHLPAAADVAGRPARRSNYENLIGFLRRDGVNLVDAHELFLEWKHEPGAPLLFTRGGTHWNQYGAARVVAKIMERLRELTGKDLPSLQVVGAETNRTIVGADNDLGELANLWSGRPLAGLQIHPVLETRPGSYRPDLLVIGDSFVFTLTNLMDRENLYRRRSTYYYNKREYFYPEAPDVAMDKQQLDLLKELQGRDAIVVEVSEYWLPKIGFGFVRDLLTAYDALDAARLAAPESD